MSDEIVYVSFIFCSSKYHIKYHQKMIHLDNKNVSFITVIKWKVMCKNNSCNPTVIKCTDFALLETISPYLLVANCETWYKYSYQFLSKFTQGFYLLAWQLMAPPGFDTLHLAIISISLLQRVTNCWLVNHEVRVFAHLRSFLLHKLHRKSCGSIEKGHTGPNR